jgi:hypothetical protein
MTTTNLTTEVPMPQSICALTGHDRKAIEAAVRKAERAAVGMSADNEINALRDAVDECLRVLGIEIESEPEVVTDTTDLVPCIAEGRHIRTRRHSAATCEAARADGEED